MKQPWFLAPTHAIRYGFTLVELSIVLAILGILLGGIMSAQSMVHTSQLRAIIKQYNDYYTAATNFRDQYGYLPGDFPNAVSIWGLASAGFMCGMASNNSGIKTCDGNGDGLLNNMVGPYNPSATWSYEVVRFWQHMSNAGLIAPIDLSIHEWPTPPTGAWQVLYFPSMSGNTYFFDGVYNNIINVYTPLTPTDIWYLDKKMDDGMPATGKLVIGCGTISNIMTCTTAVNSADLTAQYQVNNTDSITDAQPYWRQQF